jgi:seryl-tRNA synthetase
LLIENLKSQNQDSDTQISQMEKESEHLFTEIEKMKKQINVKSKELASLKNLQKIGVESDEDIEIEDAIQQLEKKAEQIRAENIQMEFEIKKLDKKHKTIPNIAGGDFVIDLSEDELAAEILRSKMK